MKRKMSIILIMVLGLASLKPINATFLSRVTSCSYRNVLQSYASFKTLLHTYFQDFKKQIASHFSFINEYHSQQEEHEQTESEESKKNKLLKLIATRTIKTLNSIDIPLNTCELLELFTNVLDCTERLYGNCTLEQLSHDLDYKAGIVTSYYISNKVRISNRRLSHNTLTDLLTQPINNNIVPTNNRYRPIQGG